MQEERSSECDISIEDELQRKILQSWELERDIERLEALKRNVANARSMVTEYPLFISYLAFLPIGNHDVLYSDDERAEECASPMDEKEVVVPVTDAEMTNTLVNALPPPGAQVHYVRSYVDMIEEFVPVAPNTGTATLTIFNRQPFRFDDGDWPFDTGSQRSPLSYCDGHSSKSGATMLDFGLAQMNFDGIQKALQKPQLEDGDRAAAHEIVERLSSVSGSIHKSKTSTSRVSVDDQSVSLGRSEETRSDKVDNKLGSKKRSDIRSGRT
jgi:hypothetical protein